jgi:hypothetical protein
MVGIVSKWLTPTQSQASTTPERCSQCGAPIPRSRITFREMAVNLICGCLLLSILVPAGLVAEHWVEDAGHRFVDRMVWREPVESWDR